MDNLCEYGHPKPCQHTDWTRKDVEDLNKGLPKGKWATPSWYRNSDAKSKWEASDYKKR